MNTFSFSVELIYFPPLNGKNVAWFCNSPKGTDGASIFRTLFGSRASASLCVRISTTNTNLDSSSSALFRCHKKELSFLLRPLVDVALCQLCSTTLGLRQLHVHVAAWGGWQASDLLSWASWHLMVPCHHLV